MSYTTFTGKRTRTGTIVLVNEGGDASANLPLYLNEVNHSPDGFEWGYYGSGPSQLAYAILRYTYGKIFVDQKFAQELAEEFYMTFKQEVIANIHAETWTLKEQDLWDQLMKYKENFSGEFPEGGD